GMIHGENTVVITYEVLEATRPFELDILPLLNGRSHHDLTKYRGDIYPESYINPDQSLFARLNHDRTGIFMSVPGGAFHQQPDWYFQFEYPVEMARGQGGHEDTFSPGHWTLNLEAGSAVAIVASTEPVAHRDGWALLDQERARRLELQQSAEARHPLTRQLTLAADQFIVKRGDNQKTIIAGYPWFTDWGRDTMIALPGLCLFSGRAADARNILDTFIDHVSDGMMPNRFPDAGGPALYNTVDGTLWFFVAVYHYFQQTGDQTFIRDRVLPVMDEIMTWHIQGTRYGIRQEEDELLSAGEDGVQLTWMDAMVGDWVVTPRRGKAVEINALWYNAWEIYAWLKDRMGVDAHIEQEKAARIRNRFQEVFWYEEGKYLYDYMLDGYRDKSVRPNQIFAISLPFPALDASQAGEVLNIVETELLTPMGLRSLSPEDDAYLGRYTGDVYARDAAYHQGTVWSWLMGPYIDALIK
ncbi:MAG: amylo-alpha-1,6-glucosidase, partial [Bacteroidota bacterium]